MQNNKSKLISIVYLPSLLLSDYSYVTDFHRSHQILVCINIVSHGMSGIILPSFFTPIPPLTK